MTDNTATKRLSANRSPVESTTEEDKDNKGQAQWNITTTLDLNRLIDQITSTAGSVANFLRDAITHYEDYYEVLSTTVPDVPVGSTINFWFSNADLSATLRFSGLVKSAEWNSQVNTIVKESFPAAVLGKNVIVVEHYNDNGLWQFDLRARANNIPIINATVAGNDNLFPNRRRLFIFKLNVIQGLRESEKPKTETGKLARQLAEFAETARSDKGVLKIDGVEFSKGESTKLQTIDKDLAKQINQRMQEATREATFRRECLENPLTRPANTSDFPIHYSIDIDTNEGWADLNWYSCKDRNCIEHKVPVDEEPSSAPASVNLPKLTAEQRQQVFEQLKTAHPELTEDQFSKLLRNQSPYQLPETESNEDVEKCIKLAREVLDAALEAAKEIKNPVLRTVAILGARLGFVLAEIQCMSDYGN
jgi:hypothetical protein